MSRWAACLFFGTNALTGPRNPWTVRTATSRQHGDVVKPASFVHHRPRTVAEATRLLSEHAAEDVRILAGGQSLVPMMAFRLARPTHLVDINGVEELATCEAGAGHVVIGALTRHKDFRRRPVPGQTGALLQAILPHIAHHPIRTRGTFCGSVAHADPASEWCLATATLDGVLVAASDGAEREIAARDWFLGAMTTALHPGELLRAVRLPLLPEKTRFAFREFSRRAGDFALAATLVVLEIEGGRMCRVRIGIGGAEERPRRMAAAESALEGCAPSPEIFARAAQLVADALDPLEDASTSAQYRRDLAASLVRHALEEATA